MGENMSRIKAGRFGDPELLKKFLIR